MANKDQTDPARMEKIVSLCKRKGFIFQSGELYGGLNGCWDMGPLGTELKRNVKEMWWRRNVQERDDVLGMDGSILTMEEILTASGHVGGFSDPMSTCKHCKVHQRADQIKDHLLTSKWVNSLVESGFFKDSETAVRKQEILQRWLKNKKTGRKLAPGLQAVLEDNFPTDWLLNIDFTSTERVLELVVSKLAYGADSTEVKLPCPHCGGILSEPKEFELMFKTNMGATGDGIAYLRPETAQSIFVQYKNVMDSNRVKLPFGIAQIGKSFRNEINPRNYIFRSREFEQMEIEFFCHPSDGLRLTDEWLEKRLQWYEEVGIPREKLHVLDIPDGERAHYSQKTYDIEYEFPFGIQELEGVAYRGAYDLTKHHEASGKPLEYFDADTKEKFIPHVVEPSAGCDRTVLALLCEAYDEEDLTKEGGKTDIRTVMRFSPKVAPVKAAIFPLLKKNEEQVRIAKEIQQELQHWVNVQYDEAGAVGRRYRRQDEIGTPFSITVDFETLGEEGEELKDTVTIRERDSMKQHRVRKDEVLSWLLKRLR